MEFLGTRLAQKALSGVFGYSSGFRGLWMEFLSTGMALEALGGNFLVPDRLQRHLTGNVLLLESFCMKPYLELPLMALADTRWLFVTLVGSSCS